MLKRARPLSAAPLPAAQKPGKRVVIRVLGPPPGLSPVVEASASHPTAPKAARVPSTQRPGKKSADPPCPFSTQAHACLDDANPLGVRGHDHDALPRSFVLGVFAGTARLSAACKRRGLATLPHMELLDGSWFDLTRRSTQDALLNFIRQGNIWYTHFGAPCSIFSRARHNIRNVQWARHKEMIGIGLAFVTVTTYRALTRLQNYWSIENPSSSRLLGFAPVARLLALPRVRFVNFDSCAYGTAYKKPTSLLTNLTALQTLARKCPGGHKHLQLRGSGQVTRVDGTTTWRTRTSAAGAYAPALCSAWANALHGAAPPGALGACPLSERERI